MRIVVDSGLRRSPVYDVSTGETVLLWWYCCGCTAVMVLPWW